MPLELFKVSKGDQHRLELWPRRARDTYTKPKTGLEAVVRSMRAGFEVTGGSDKDREPQLGLGNDIL